MMVLDFTSTAFGGGVLKGESCICSKTRTNITSGVVVMQSLIGVFINKRLK